MPKALQGHSIAKLGSLLGDLARIWGGRGRTRTHKKRSGPRGRKMRRGAAAYGNVFLIVAHTVQRDGFFKKKPRHECRGSNFACLLEPFHPPPPPAAQLRFPSISFTSIHFRQHICSPNGCALCTKLKLTARLVLHQLSIWNEKIHWAS